MSVTADQVIEVLQTIDDPEMPISIVELGIVADIRLPTGGVIEVDITPTFVGCPALEMIRNNIVDALAQRFADAQARVRFVNKPVWSSERITPAGRERLRAFGVTVADRMCGASADDDAAPFVPLTISAESAVVPCPYCDSDRTRMESPFGPTRCRMIYYCDACRNSFEQIKPI